MAQAGSRRSKAVLITGCSTGIGRATAQRFARGGWPVYATARKLEAVRDLEAEGCRALALDVDSEESMKAAVAAVESDHGAVGVLINNAGYSQSGAIESVPMARIRSQFETNVFGLVRMCQLVLPAMREQGWGKIVNLSSMGGKLTFPGGGVYHATKYAVEALSDALRFEVAGFGIDVVVIEPGLIRTHFGDAVVDHLQKVPSEGGPYAEFNSHVAKSTKEVYEKGPLAKLGGGPDKVAAVIERAVMAARPRARYTVTPSATMLMGQRRILSDRFWDGFLRTQFPQPRGRH
jgi:NAD(P)-dependent dehydrogenase (short-subunit alcohol dehydrogenase family)